MNVLSWKTYISLNNSNICAACSRWQAIATVPHTACVQPTWRPLIPSLWNLFGSHWGTCILLPLFLQICILFLPINSALLSTVGDIFIASKKATKARKKMTKLCYSVTQILSGLRAGLWQQVKLGMMARCKINKASNLLVVLAAS